MLKGRYQALIFSVVFHLVFLIILVSTQFKTKPIPVVKQSPKAIKSFIYKPIIEKVVEVTEKNKTVSPPPMTTIKPADKPVIKTIDKPVNNLEKPNKNTKQTIDHTSLQPKENKRPENRQKPIKPVSKFLASKSIQDLKTNMRQKGINQNAADSYQEFLAQQQIITPSTSSNQPEEFAKPINVDCNSDMKKGVLAVLAIVGSRITCSKISKLAPFIDKRLKKTGIK